MDSFEINKVLGALLGMLTLTMGVGFLSEAFVNPKKPFKLGYELPEPHADGAAPVVAAVAAEPIAVRLASADLAKGEASSKKCVSCHQFGKDGKNGTGPALYGVLARAKGAVGGFNYSAALKERAGKGETWDYEALDAFIANPKGYLPGTAMNYAGIARPDERANIIAYIRTLAESPAPLPQ